MMLDKQNLFSDQQNLAQAAATYVSTNAIDLGTPGTLPGLGGTAPRDPGKGKPVQAFAQVTQTFTSGGAGTLQVQLVEADATDLATGVVVLAETIVLALATLVAGYQFRFGSWPQGTAKRFIGLRYIIGTAAMTAGKVTAGIILDRQTTSV